MLLVFLILGGREPFGCHGSVIVYFLVLSSVVRVVHMLG